jgi:peptide/nickel transport system ATP-binding protein
VMHRGRVVESGRCEKVFSAPQHEYTKALLEAIPLPQVDEGWLAELRA